MNTQHIRFGLGVALVLACLTTYAQTSDDSYRRPLQDVLDKIQSQFHVEVKYTDDLVRDRYVSYAGWRFRDYDVEQTLANVLTPLDLSFSKDADGSYKLKKYEYWRRPVDEGRKELDYLASLYHDAASWQQRKEVLRNCLRETLGLSRIAARPASKPIVTAQRKMNGYTVENVAIETLPGVYVSGSLYRPLRQKGKAPIVLCPNGHFAGGRYRPDQQYRCATLARMGAWAFSYDLFAWGESQLQFTQADHRESLAQVMQIMNGIRILDYLCGLPGADPERVGITGASGGGSQTMLLTALDDRIKVSVPVVMLSCYFYGGCPCETGRPVHQCAGGTNNVEIAAMAAPRPQLIVSDGKDWTDHVPEIEFPYLQKVYGYYDKAAMVKNIHLAGEGHDYGISKRMAMYPFMATHLGLNLAAIKNKSGAIDETPVTIEAETALKVFGPDGNLLPANAINGFTNLKPLFPDL
jgi:dienelactone hydrolase